MKEIENANATRGNVYTIQTTQIHRTPFKLTNNKQEGKTSIRMIEFSRMREQETSTSRIFVRLNVVDYKRARQSRRQLVVIQLALCEVAVVV